MVSLKKADLLAKRLAREALDAIYPRHCVETGRPLTSESTAFRYLSNEAIRELSLVTEECQCVTCGYPFYGDTLENTLCPNCTELRPKFNEGRTGFLLENTGRTIVHELKYRDGYYLWKDVGMLLEWIPGFLEFAKDAILVPVPLHPLKYLQRGFNQSELLAKEIQTRSSGAKVEKLLKRVRYTQVQAHLNKEQRRRNVFRAFDFKGKKDFDPEAKYIIVDDVFTTGATLNACAKVLRKQGISNINIITLAHG